MALTVGGFAIVGAGQVASVILAAMAPQRDAFNYAVFFSVDAVGLALAIPGLVMLVREGDEETQARESFFPGRRAVGLQDSPSKVLGRTFAARLLSVPF
jgi:hypothetical protein